MPLLIYWTTLRRSCRVRSYCVARRARLSVTSVAIDGFRCGAHLGSNEDRVLSCARFSESLGVARYKRDRFLKRNPTIIEYK